MRPAARPGSSLVNPRTAKEPATHPHGDYPSGEPRQRRSLDRDTVGEAQDRANVQDTDPLQKPERTQQEEHGGERTQNDGHRTPCGVPTDERVRVDG